MPEFLTPGVYFEKHDAAPPIRRVRTDIAGFVGLAERGALWPPERKATWEAYQAEYAAAERGSLTPVQIESWRQFQAEYGNFVSYGYLGYAVKGFFENGGTTCVVVRVAGHQAASAELVLKSAAGAGTIRIAARNEGTWGNRITVVLTQVNSATRRFSLMVVRDRDREVFPDLSIDLHDQRYFADIVNRGDDRRSRSRWIRVEPAAAEAAVDAAGGVELPDAAASGLVNRTGVLAGGADGIASLTKTDFTTGLDALKRVDVVAMVAVPDIHIQRTVTAAAPPPPAAPPTDPCTPRPAPAGVAATTTAGGTEQPPLFADADVLYVQQAALEHCEYLRDRVAIFDVPLLPGGRTRTLAGVQEWREHFDSPRGFAALYHPWIKVVDPLTIGGELVRTIPPCGHVAGVYAATDLSVGVHKAPANVALEWAEDVTVEIDDALQAMLNPEGINCVRPFPGRGLRIYGARTVTSDASWRFVNVRRLLLMIEEAVDESTQWSVFEPNDYNLRQKIVLTVTTFLESLRREGALAGATPAHAYFVKCDETNNPRSIADAGRLVIDIGVAPSIPLEFIVFRIGRTIDELEVVER